MKKSLFKMISILLTSLMCFLCILGLFIIEPTSVKAADDEELVAELNSTDINKISKGGTSYVNSYGTWNFSSGVTDKGSGPSIRFYFDDAVYISIDTGNENLLRVEYSYSVVINKPSSSYPIRSFVYLGQRGVYTGNAYQYKMTASHSGNESNTVNFYFSQLNKQPSQMKGNVTICFDALSDQCGTVDVTSIKIYAKIPYETVSLNKQSGTGGSSSVNATPGAAMPSATMPTRTGYTFGGYFTGTNGSGDKYYDANGASAKNWVKGAATTLYAKWTANTYTVKYNANKPSNATSEVTDLPSNDTWTYDANSTLGSAPSLTGWTFDGWYKESSCTNKLGDAGANVSNANLVGSGTGNVYAKWTANTYTVKYNANKPSNATSEVTDLPSDGTWTYDNNNKLGAAPALEGWTFDGWYKEAECTNKVGVGGANVSNANLVTSGTTTLYAKWVPNKYTVSYDSNKPSKAPESYEVTELPSNDTWTYDSETSVNLGTEPKLVGYVFDGWYKEATCENKLGDKEESLLKPNLSSQDGSTITLYAKWIFNSAIQDVVDKINTTKTCTYDELTDQINASNEAYNALDSEYKAVVDSEGYTHLLDNAKAADHAGQMIEDLGQALNTEEWRKAVSDAREAYTNLEDKTLIPNDPILQMLIDDEAAIVVMDLINNIGDPRWTSTSKILIDTAQSAYDSYIDANHPHKQIANYQTLVDANSVFDNVDAFVEKVSEIKSLPFAYTPECKELIDNARRYYERVLNDYQKEVVSLDALPYYEYLVNCENAYKAMRLIDDINDMENTPECKEFIEDARDKVNSLDLEKEYPLVNEEFLEELTDKEAAWAVIEKINDIFPLVFDKDCIDKINDAKEAYALLSVKQQGYVVNYDLLVKAEEDYNAVKNAVNSVSLVGDIKYDGESKDKIDNARLTYEELTDEQKEFFPTESLIEILDYEIVYEVLSNIYGIGDVKYDTDSEDKINDTRALYDKLTDDQKELLDQEDYEVLLNSETEFDDLKKGANVLVTILLIFDCLAIIGAGFMLWYLLIFKKDKDEDGSSKKQKPVKMMSVGGLSTFILLTSHYADASYIALYILSVIALLAWGAVLAIVLLRKSGKEIKMPSIKMDEIKKFFKKVFSKIFKSKHESSSEEPKEKIEEAPLPQKDEAEEMVIIETKVNEDGDESITTKDSKGNIFQIRYIKSFTAKFIQAPTEAKKYYEELKNYVLSYKKTTSRISWNYDSINFGRNQVLKFAVRGKTLCVYFPLNADDYAESKYKVEKVESKKFEDVPCLYRIKNDRRLGYAKELIKVVVDKLGLKKGDDQHESYILPFEETKPLINRGLIKELKIQVNNPNERVILETKINSEGDEIVTTKDSKGNIFQIKYIKSFTAKLSQASDEVKNYYNLIKNHVLSYKKANSRISWHYDAINVGRNQVIKFAIRGKTLCVYYALNEVDDKYKVEMVESKKFVETPCLYRIKNDRRSIYAKELIDIIMKKLHVNKGEALNEDFSIPYEETKSLLSKGLIKELTIKVLELATAPKPVSVEEADKRMSDEAATQKITEDLNGKKHEGKKSIINIDTIGENFNDDDKVDIEALWEKKLIPNNVGFVKVLARGTLNKKLNLELQDYSIQAVKMVLLEGGTVKKAR